MTTEINLKVIKALSTKADEATEKNRKEKEKQDREDRIRKEKQDKTGIGMAQAKALIRDAARQRAKKEWKTIDKILIGYRSKRILLKPDVDNRPYYNPLHQEELADIGVGWMTTRREKVGETLVQVTRNLYPKDGSQVITYVYYVPQVNRNTPYLNIFHEYEQIDSRRTESLRGLCYQDFLLLPAGRDRIIVIEAVVGRAHVSEIVTGVPKSPSDGWMGISAVDLPLSIFATVVTKNRVDRITVPASVTARYQSIFPQSYTYTAGSYSSYPTDPEYQAEVDAALALNGGYLGYLEAGGTPIDPVFRVGYGQQIVYPTLTSTPSNIKPVSYFWSTTRYGMLNTPSQGVVSPFASPSEWNMEAYYGTPGGLLAFEYYPEIPIDQSSISISTFFGAKGGDPPLKFLQPCGQYDTCTLNSVNFDYTFDFQTYDLSIYKPSEIPAGFNVFDTWFPTGEGGVGSNDATTFIEAALMVWDWDQPAYCQEKILAMGFLEEEVYS